MPDSPASAHPNENSRSSCAVPGHGDGCEDSGSSPQLTQTHAGLGFEVSFESASTCVGVPRATVETEGGFGHDRCSDLPGPEVPREREMDPRQRANST